MKVGFKTTRCVSVTFKYTLVGQKIGDEMKSS